MQWKKLIGKKFFYPGGINFGVRYIYKTLKINGEFHFLHTIFK